MIYTTPKGSTERNEMLTYRVTTASDSTHDVFDSNGDVVAEYLPTADAVVSHFAEAAMYNPIKLTAREQHLMDALAPYGAVSADRWSVVL